MILRAEDVLGGLISTLILISSPIYIKYLYKNIINVFKYHTHNE
ncbi:MAG: hypothetical protein ACRC92_13585 [Peptostreptococcaceae bacterium]